MIGQRTEVEMGFANRYRVCRLAAPIAEPRMRVYLTKVEVHILTYHETGLK